MVQPRNIKLDLLIPDFSDFGAIRLAINVANALRRDYEVTVVVFQDNGLVRQYLHSDIKVVELPLAYPGAARYVWLPRFCRKYIIPYYQTSVLNRTDVAVSFSPSTNLVVLMAKLFNRKLKVVIQEHCFPTVALKDRQNMNRRVEWLFRLFVFRLYNRADAFMTCAQAAADDFVANFNIKPGILRVVRNPIDSDKIGTLAAEPVSNFTFAPSAKYLLGVGRLVDQKDFFKLLRVFQLVREKVVTAELIIIGDGPDRGGLEAEAARIGCRDCVHLVGYQHNVPGFMARADCFCLTSRWEALPAVLAEAMICRMPIVANDCRSGPSEMLADNQTGIVVPMDDERAFAERVIHVLQDPALGKRLGTNAAEFARREYSMDGCLRKYRAIIDGVASSACAAR